MWQADLGGKGQKTTLNGSSLIKNGRQVKSAKLMVSFSRQLTVTGPKRTFLMSEYV